MSAAKDSPEGPQARAVPVTLDLDASADEAGARVVPRGSMRGDGRLRNVMLIWLIVLAVLLVAGVATLVALMAVGRLTLDLRWGRSLHALGPIVMRVAAPREVVFGQLAAPYLGRTPKALRDHLEVVEQGEDMVLGLHRTKVSFYTAETTETVRFEHPERVSFRHVRGPVPHAVEEFVLHEDGDETMFEYRGEIGLDLWLVGRLAARWWVRPIWEGEVRGSMEQVKQGSEARPDARARRRPRPEPHPTESEPSRRANG